MKINILSLFPEIIEAFKSYSVIAKALQLGHIEINVINFREFSKRKHHEVDDTIYGGGDGMLLMPEPLFEAINEVKKNIPNAKVILMTPRGESFKQKLAKEMADSNDDYIFVCGRYEGFDERVFEIADGAISIGDYVLTGGELPAMVIIDSITRLIPGVLGGENSALIESFSDGETLEFPQYTRPSEYEGLKVPEVLLSGNHGEIARWRKEHSIKKLND